MKHDTDKDFVLSLLQNMGFYAEPIPEASYKTPDLKVMMPEGDLLVEVISKEDDKQLRDLLDSPTRNSPTPTTCLQQQPLYAMHGIRFVTFQTELTKISH